MAYQSLYRRYRPRRFAEVRGQDPIVTALRNAVRDGRYGHAYLFSGPRGTGKTTTARILAKVLNCENPQDGEPCLQCASCVAVEAGTSFDVHELDAASNRGINEMKDLIASTALASPGRTKLYILDEVHMLTKEASAALLKTLEEPPASVVFVLATTDPQKVLPTIRSRTQHFEFHLLPAAELSEHVRWIIKDADLTVDETAIAHVLRVGGGSARDTLSALDQVVAAGGVGDRELGVDDLLEALLQRDPGRALVVVADAVGTGRDPRVLGEILIGRLRDVFLAAMRAPLTHLSDADGKRVEELAGRIERPFITRCLEVLGEAQTKMPEAPDQRIVLEAALVRLADVDSDTSVAALLERIERLERAVSQGGGLPAPASGPDRPGPASSGAPPVGAGPAPAPGSGGGAPGEESSRSAAGRPGDAARAALGQRGPAPRPPRPAPAAGPAPVAKASPRPSPSAPNAGPAAAQSAPPAPNAGSAPVPPAPNTGSSSSAPAGGPPSAAPSGDGLPTRDQLTLAWGDSLLGQLPRAVKAVYGGGRFVAVDGGHALFALPNEAHRARCEKVRGDVEQVLGRAFGVPVPLRLVVDDGSVPPSSPSGSSSPANAAPARPAPGASPPPAQGPARPVPPASTPPASPPSGTPSASASPPGAAAARPAVAAPRPSPAAAARAAAAAAPRKPVAAPPPDDAPPPADDDYDYEDVAGYEDAPSDHRSGVELLIEAFPGSEVSEDGP